MEEITRLNTSTDAFMNRMHHLIPADLDLEQRARALRVNPKLKTYYELEDLKKLSISPNSNDIEKVEFGKKLSSFQKNVRTAKDEFNNLLQATSNISSKGKNKGLNKATIEKQQLDKISNSMYDSFVYPHIFSKDDYKEYYETNKPLPIPPRGKRFNVDIPYLGFILYGLVLLIASILIHVFTKATEFDAIGIYVLAVLLGVSIPGFIHPICGILESLGDVANSCLTKLLNFIFYKKQDNAWKKETSKIYLINSSRNHEREKIQDKYKKIKADFLKENKGVLLLTFADLQESLQDLENCIFDTFGNLYLPSDDKELDFCLGKLTHKNASKRASSLNEAREMYRFQERKRYEKEEAERQERLRQMREEAEQRERERNAALRNAILAVPELIRKGNEAEQEKTKKIEELNKELEKLNKHLED